MSVSPVDEEALFELVDEDPDFLVILIRTFLDDCSTYMEELRRAVAENDAEALVREAHGLRGAVANLQAQPAHQAVLRLEELGRSGDLEEAPAALCDLEAEIDRLTQALHGVVEHHADA